MKTIHSLMGEIGMGLDSNVSCDLGDIHLIGLDISNGGKDSTTMFATLIRDEDSHAFYIDSIANMSSYYHKNKPLTPWEKKKKYREGLGTMMKKGRRW